MQSTESFKVKLKTKIAKFNREMQMETEVTSYRAFPKLSDGKEAVIDCVDVKFSEIENMLFRFMRCFEAAYSWELEPHEKDFGQLLIQEYNLLEQNRESAVISFSLTPIKVETYGTQTI
jgi:hypothetical protein